MEKLGIFFKGESGEAAVEYSLMVALIALAIIATAMTLGETLNGTFNYLHSKLPA